MNITTRPSAARPSISQGLLIAAAAYLIFTVQDVLVRLLVKADMPIWQVLLVRSLCIVVACLCLKGPKVIGDSIVAPSRRSLIARGVLILAAWLCYYTASKTLLYGQLVTIYYAAPIIITILSLLILKERVTATRWLAVFVGFIGVLIACEPGKLGLSMPVLLTLAAAVMWGMSNILLRKAGITENVLMQMFMSNAIFAIGCGGPTVFWWHAPTAVQWMELLGVGVLGGCAQYLLFKSFRMAPASAIAPMEYSSLLWAFSLGYLIWQEVPGHGVVLGALLIAGSGIGTLLSERWQQRRLAAASSV
ncbi:MAG TPA: DMT family transporter [Terriglobia bacterium]|nr:DMT family transporter [Terriglobia bacterium]